MTQVKLNGSLGGGVTVGEVGQVPPTNRSSDAAANEENEEDNHGSRNGGDESKDMHWHWFPSMLLRLHFILIIVSLWKLMVALPTFARSLSGCVNITLSGICGTARLVVPKVSTEPTIDNPVTEEVLRDAGVGTGVGTLSNLPC